MKRLVMCLCGKSKFPWTGTFLTPFCDTSQIFPLKSCKQAVDSFISTQHSQMNRFTSSIRKIKSPLAILFLLAFLMVEAMAVSETLHELVHHDSAQSQHQCAVKLFSAGHIDLAGSQPAVVAPTTLVMESYLPTLSVLVQYYDLLPPGRAPPAVLL